MVVTIQGNEYTVYPSYPKFGFHKDEKDKYSVACIEEKTATSHFFDQCFISNDQERAYTWVENYVVCRVGDKFYLMDCKGNCYFENDEQFIICRNGFLTRDMKKFIAKGLIAKDVKDGVVSLGRHSKNKVSIEQYNTICVGYFHYALAFEDRGLLDVNGNICDGSYPGSNADRYNYKGLSEWYFETICNYVTTCHLLNFDLEVIGDYGMVSTSLVSLRSGIYKAFPRNDYNKDDFIYISSKLGEKKIRYVTLCDVEFVWSGKATYIYLPDGTEEKIDCLITTPRFTGDAIVYRQGNMIVIRDKKGKVIEEMKLSPKEVYELILLEERGKKLHITN